MAVRSVAPEPVAAALGLEAVPSTWAQGIGGAYAGTAVFISPAIEGWVLVVGRWVSTPTLEQRRQRLLELGTRFGEAQLFDSDRVTDRHEWALAREHNLIRHRAVAGETVLCDLGPRVPPEPAGDAASEDDLFRIAAAWSIDPMQLWGPPAGFGLAAPTGDTGIPEGALLVEPGAANSVQEADFHVAEVRCPRCGSHIQPQMRRPGLPWEPFAYLLDARCPGCGARIAVIYAAGPSWADPPDADEPALSRHPGPSPLLTPDRLQKIAEASLRNVEAGIDPSITRRSALTGLGALRELDKHGAGGRLGDRRAELEARLRAALSRR